MNAGFEKFGVAAYIILGWLGGPQSSKYNHLHWLSRCKWISPKGELARPTGNQLLQPDFARNFREKIQKSGLFASKSAYGKDESAFGG